MIDENRILRAEIAGLCDALDAAAKIVMGPLRQGDNGGPMLEDAI